MARVCVTGDFHGRGRPEIPDCDLLLLHGDLGVNFGSTLGPMFAWAETLVYRGIQIVTVAGNHDFDTRPLVHLDEAGLWRYLEDEAAEVCGLKVWGSPWTPTFLNWAFMADESRLAAEWRQSPDDIDVLLTHGPPYGHCDLAQETVHVGSTSMLERIDDGSLEKLRLVACGHIHEGYGCSTISRDGLKPVVVANGSWVNERYEPGNPPIVLEL